MGFTRRSWTRSAVRTGMAAAAGAKALYNAYKKGSSYLKKSPRRVRRVVRRTATRRVVRRRRVVSKSFERNPTGSTFVKCRDVKLRSNSEKLSAFARKVMMATMPDFAIKQYVEEYSIYGKAGPKANTKTTSGQVVGWTQIALNTLSALSNSSSQSAVYFSDMVGTGNPCGLQDCATIRSGENGQSAANDAPKDIRTLVSLAGLTNSTTVSQRIWSGKRYIKLELRNPQQFGIRLHIFYVKSKTTSPYVNSAGAQSGNTTDCDGNTISFGSASYWSWSPLECLAYGLNKRGLVASQIGNSRHIGLNDSPDFKERWNPVTCCSVYIPPGGTMYKKYNLPSRVLSAAHITDNIYDRQSAFLMIKCVPEVQLLPSSTNAVGSVIGVNHCPGDATATDVYTSTYPDPHWIGTLCVRTSFRLLPSTTTNDVIIPYNANTILPSGKPVYNAHGPQAQNNDIGTRSTTGR